MFVFTAAWIVLVVQITAKLRTLPYHRFKCETLVMQYSPHQHGPFRKYHVVPMRLQICMVALGALLTRSLPPAQVGEYDDPLPGAVVIFNRGVRSPATRSGIDVHLANAVDVHADANRCWLHNDLCHQQFHSSGNKPTVLHQLSAHRLREAAEPGEQDPVGCLTTWTQVVRCSVAACAPQVILVALAVMMMFFHMPKLDEPIVAVRPSQCIVQEAC